MRFHYMPLLKHRAAATAATAAIAMGAVVAAAFAAAGTRPHPGGAPALGTAHVHPQCAAETAGERRTDVMIPEVYELANIALSLTAYAEREAHTIWRHGPYYAAVMQHFGRHRDHPLIQRLDEVLAGSNGWRRYYAFRESSAAWAFDGSALARTTTRQYWPEDLFSPHLALVEDFAAETGFRGFYRDHVGYYDAEVQRFRELVAMDDMWSWLEERFPQRYAGYAVVFSPLIHGSHSTRRFAADREMIMFVAGPAVADTLPPELAARRLARIVFTEIDHNYVNPTTDLHVGTVNELMSDLGRWNDEPDGAYPSAYATFNEYMTWAVFSLYLRDRFAEPEAAMAEVERAMERRGFPRFSGFNRALLDIAAAQGETCVPALYEPVLEWMRTQATES